MAEADWSSDPLPPSRQVGDGTPIAPDTNKLLAALGSLRANLGKPSALGNQLTAQTTSAAVRSLIAASADNHTHPASAVVSGQLDPARLGAGTASSTTILYGDGQWRTAPTGGGSTVTASQISDSSTIGRAVLTSADAATARNTIGAGTSNLTLGSTSSTAKAGDYAPPTATTTVPGLVQLAGDLAGTATAPTVPNKAARALTKRTVTGAYTLVLADGTDVILHSTATAATTITLPTNASVAIPQEQAIPWRQFGTGQLTFAAASGVTIVSRTGGFKSAGQYAEGIITKVATNTWLLTGDVVTGS